MVYQDLSLEPGEPLLRVIISLSSNLLLQIIGQAIDFFAVVVYFYALVEEKSDL